MRWVRHYRKKKSMADELLSRKRRRDEMGRKRKEKSANQEGMISPEKHFFLTGGGSLSSIEELALRLETVSDAQFAFHVNSEKNDFANWIKDVFGKEELAAKLQQATDKKECQIVLLKHLHLDNKKR